MLANGLRRRQPDGAPAPSSGRLVVEGALQVVHRALEPEVAQAIVDQLTVLVGLTSRRAVALYIDIELHLDDLERRKEAIADALP